MNDFYSDHVNKIFTYCKYRVSDYQEAQDLTSETFLKFLKSDGLTKSNPTGYLYTICRNNIIDYYRKSSKHPKTYECINEQLSDEGIQDHQLQSKIELLQLLDQLDHESKEILLLKFVQGLDIVSISQIINKSESATKSQIYRSLDQLKKIVAQQGVNYD